MSSLASVIGHLRSVTPPVLYSARGCLSSVPTASSFSGILRLPDEVESYKLMSKTVQYLCLMDIFVRLSVWWLCLPM